METKRTTVPACHLCQESCDCDRCKLQRAAPDLLAALERIVANGILLADGASQNDLRMLDAAEAAIRNAKGGK